MSNTKKDKSHLRKAVNLQHENNEISFLLAKIERFVAALYLVTNLLPQNEPLRLQIREAGLNVLYYALHSDSFEEKELFSAFFDSLLEVLGLLRIATVSDNLSSMNCELLIREGSFIFQCASQESLFASRIPAFENNFFAVAGPNDQKQMGKEGQKKEERRWDAEMWEGLQKVAPHSPSSFSKGQNKLNASIGRKSVVRTDFSTRSERREHILKLVQENGTVSIKDISSVITNCSEKTLQRELMALVEQGVLKREGKKRWSTYLLA